MNNYFKICLDITEKQTISFFTKLSAQGIDFFKTQKKTKNSFSEYHFFFAKIFRVSLRQAKHGNNINTTNTIKFSCRLLIEYYIIIHNTIYYLFFELFFTVTERVDC